MQQLVKLAQIEHQQSSGEDKLTYHPKTKRRKFAINMESEKKQKNVDEKAKKKEENTENAISEEDQELKDRLETCVSTLINKDLEDDVTVPIRLKALDVIVTDLRSSTSSMTSVPKPLKFLRPHFAVLKDFHISLMKESDVEKGNDFLLLRARLADVLAVLAMTMGNHGKFLCAA